MTTPTHRDDSSLQGWGRNLKTVAPALDELGRMYSQVHDADVSAVAAVRKLAAQAETDLPVAKPLAAEVQSVADELSAIAAEQEALNNRRRKARDRSEVLPATYRREHETDEDRLNTPRNGRAAEKRADLHAAERDN
jgi:hypothetical protein